MKCIDSYHFGGIGAAPKSPRRLTGIRVEFGPMPDSPVMKPTRGPGGEPHHPATNPVFERMRAEHAWVLETLDALDRELAGRRESAAGRATFPAAAVRPLAERLAREFAAHATAEDDVLVPLLAGGVPGGPSHVRQLVAEHAELRAMLAAFLATLGAPASARRDEQLTVQAHDFTALMRCQIRKEETLVFAIAEKQIARGAAAHRTPGRANPRGAHAPRPRPSKGEPQ